MIVREPYRAGQGADGSGDRVVTVGDGARREDDPGFCRRVLECSPTALLVVDDHGRITYGNRAAEALTGWPLDEARGTSILDRLHPDDATWAAEAFVRLAGSQDAREEDPSVWPPLTLRIVHREGHPVPIEVQGTGTLSDPVLRGIVYHMHPIEAQELLLGVLNGLAGGAPVREMVADVAAIVAAPPLDISAAILEHGRDGDVVLATSDSAAARIAAELLEVPDSPPWEAATQRPVHLPAEALTPRACEALRREDRAGYFHVAVTDESGETLHRIVGFSRAHHVPANAALQRLERTRDLLAAVLLRAGRDELLLHAATHDALTGLPDRQGWQRALAAAAPPAGVVVIDLDGFKPINDEHGHAVGDEILRTVAARLQAATRPDDVVARVGGDEFAVLLVPDGRDGERLHDDVVADVARRVLDAIRMPIRAAGAMVHLSASIGVAVTHEEVVLDELVDRADAAMYEAKRGGGDRHRLTTVSA